MEHGSQMYIFFIGMKRVREQCLCIFFVVFGGKGAEGKEIIASRFPAIVCDGESQLYIFNVGGSDIRACHADSFGQLPQVSKGLFMFMIFVVFECLFKFCPAFF